MSDDTLFLDTNVLLRLFLSDHAEHSPRTLAFLARAARGEMRLAISDTVVFETAYILEKQHGLERADIAESIIQLIEKTGVQFLGVTRPRDMFDLYLKYRRLSIADCYHASIALNLGSGTIVSFDRGFDRIDGLTRIEPPELSED